MGQGRVKDAQTEFEGALATSKQINGEWSEQTLNLMNSLATCLSMQDKKSEADRLFQELLVKAKSTDSPNLASYLANHGLHLVQNQLYQQAKRFCLEAYGLSKRLRGDEEVLKTAELCLNRIKAGKRLGE